MRGAERPGQRPSNSRAHGFWRRNCIPHRGGSRRRDYEVSPFGAHLGLVLHRFCYFITEYCSSQAASFITEDLSMLLSLMVWKTEGQNQRWMGQGVTGTTREDEVKGK